MYDNLDTELFRVSKIGKSISDNIDKHGFIVLGIMDNPPFGYTVGLHEKVGFELIMVGLRMEHAHVIFTNIYNEYIIQQREIPINVPVEGLANLPTIFRKCSKDLVERYGVKAFEYYGKDVDFLQLVMPDKNGLFPHDQDYDITYMGPRQHLLYRLPI